MNDTTWNLWGSNKQYHWEPLGIQWTIPLTWNLWGSNEQYHWEPLGIQWTIPLWTSGDPMNNTTYLKPLGIQWTIPLGTSGDPMNNTTYLKPLGIQWTIPLGTSGDPMNNTTYLYSPGRPSKHWRPRRRSSIFSIGTDTLRENKQTLQGKQTDPSFLCSVKLLYLSQTLALLSLWQRWWEQQEQTGLVTKESTFYESKEQPASLEQLRNMNGHGVHVTNSSQLHAHFHADLLKTLRSSGVACCS